MKYIVIEAFVDLEDENHLYRAGDEYPRPGVKPSRKRVDSLATRNNNVGRPMIRKAREAAKEPPEAGAGEIPAAPAEAAQTPAEGAKSDNEQGEG